jgi:hypothetical protein
MQHPNRPKHKHMGDITYWFQGDTSQLTVTSSLSSGPSIFFQLKLPDTDTYTQMVYTITQVAVRKVHDNKAWLRFQLGRSLHLGRGQIDGAMKYHGWSIA